MSLFLPQQTCQGYKKLLDFVKVNFESILFGFIFRIFRFFVGYFILKSNAFHICFYTKMPSLKVTTTTVQSIEVTGFYLV